eukprot:Gregarina_sp_Poly_1__5642@NODE_2976_length_1488_cov_7_147783_g1879_i0_p1_GENE_NODE_2976_length_1488_cov_7_147783_g1879_i0NODE_2976_length_1488_cov_7_147783_g1879_i0_p1_ORF_typecomplete_len172_score20_76_NODE_2976_length_1488_cov_7_147783_g1879_i05431058
MNPFAILVLFLAVFGSESTDDHAKQRVQFPPRNPWSPLALIDTLLNLEVTLPTSGPPESLGSEVFPRLYIHTPVPDAPPTPLLRPAIEIPGVAVFEAVPRALEVSVAPPGLIDWSGLSATGLNRFVPNRVRFLVPNFIQPIPGEAPKWLDRPWLGAFNPALNYMDSEATTD